MKPNPDKSIAEYSPTELEKLVREACPCFEENDSNIASVHLAIHSFCCTYISNKLLERLEDIFLEREKEANGGRGRLDIKVSVRYSRVVVKNGERTVAVIEVKTGSAGVLQPCYYSYSEQCNVLIAEVARGEVYEITPKSAEKMLGTCIDLIRTREKLKAGGKVIPNPFSCVVCGNRRCEYFRGTEIRGGVATFLPRKIDALTDNLPRIVEKLADYLKGYT
jgi:hypothetical protein